MPGRLSTRAPGGATHSTHGCVAVSTGSRLAKAAGAAIGAAAGLAAYDLTQRRHAILRNFPVIGHLRYLLEGIGPELRQYIVTEQRRGAPVQPRPARWVYASAKQENNYFGFGTDNDVEHTAGYPIIKHRTFPGRVPRPTPHAGDEVVAAVAPRCWAAPRGRREGVPARLGGQHLGDELRLAVAAAPSRRSTGARRWPAACTTPARAASRRTTATAATWSSRSAPRTSAAATSTAASTSARLKDLVAARAGAGDRDQAQPGRQAGPGRPAARRRR